MLIANLLAQLAFGLLAMTICLPSMQEWGAIFGASQAAVQLSFSGFVVAYGCLQLLYGPLSDRLGRKKILLVGLSLAPVGWMATCVACACLTGSRWPSMRLFAPSNVPASVNASVSAPCGS